MKASLAHFEWFIFWVVVSVALGIGILSFIESQYVEKKIKERIVKK